MRPLLLLLSLIANASLAQPNIYISEILASNDNSIEAEDGENYDWIELFNDGDNTVSIAGYYVTDDLSEPNKFQLSTTATDLIIPAKGFLILYASGETSVSSKHLDFKLSAGGEAVGLYDQNLNPIDEITFVDQKTDVSYGRFPENSSNFFYFFPSNPGIPNDDANAYIGFLDPPVFSHQGGFFDEDFLIEVSTPDTTAKIVYTLDGSEPSTENLTHSTYFFKNSYPENPGDPFGQKFPLTFGSYLYNNPILVKDRTEEPNKISRVSTTFNYQFPTYIPSYQNEKGTVIRARIEKEGYLPSEVVTHTFLKKEGGERKYDMPTISLTFNENELFDYENGISVPGNDFDQWRIQNPFTTDLLSQKVGNYYRRGREHEIPANFEYFQTDNAGLNQKIGLRVHGNISRHFPQKSLRLYARNDYGEDTFDYPLFSNEPDVRHSRLILRNGGNDHFFTLFRDALIHESCKGLHFETQASTPTILYLNGEYWGITNIRERFDDDYFENKYGIDKDSIDILESSFSPYSVDYGDSDSYEALLDFIDNNDLTSSANYNQISELIDIDNFIDYQSTEIFYNNQDWPANNIQFWRKKVSAPGSTQFGHDGKWRWNLFDMDYGLGSAWASEPSPEFNALQRASYGGLWETKILHNLLKNPSFKESFILRNLDLLNTYYDTGYLSSMIDEKQNVYKNSILDHIRRWNEPLEFWNSPISTDYWVSQINQMKSWASVRPTFHLQHLQGKFGLSETFTITLDLDDKSAGSIQLNTIIIDENTPGTSNEIYPWSGDYIKNMNNRLVALPKKGYSFTYWEVNGNQVFDDTLLINTTQNSVEVKAFFKLDVLSENPFPIAYNLGKCEYLFTEWDEEAPTGSFPKSMAFVYMNEDDPAINASIAGNTSGVFNLDSRTRINGLNKNGFSFINTGNSDGNPGYPGTRLGGAILALNTEGVTSARLKWTGRTIEANSREYNLALKYRIGDAYPFSDFLDLGQNPLIYLRQSAGDSLVFDLPIPDTLLGQTYIQFLWQYYYTGIRNDENSGARDQLAIDDIIIETILENNEQPSGTASRIILSETLPVANYHFKASKSIELNSGFNTSDSLVLKAEIGNCLNE